MDIDKTTERIIGCAIEVHRVLGPGLFEATYESALCVEFDLNDLRYVRQSPVPILYKQQVVGDFRSTSWWKTRWWSK
jgi:GxxExxY protein